MQFANRWKNKIIRHEDMPVSELTPNPKNWRKHPKGQAEALSGAIEEVGYLIPVTWNERTGKILDGHLRVELARANHEETIPVNVVDLSEEEEAKALLTLDPITAMAEADKDLLKALMDQVSTDNEGIQKMIDGLAQDNGLNLNHDTQAQARIKLIDKFIVPPFTVLDARQGYWQERKAAWIGLGIKSELGRGSTKNTSARAAPGKDPSYRQIKTSRYGGGGKIDP